MIGHLTNAPSSPPAEPSSDKPPSPDTVRQRRRRARQRDGVVLCTVPIDIEQVEGLRREGLLTEDDEESTVAVLLAVRTYLEKLRVTRDITTENFD